MSSNERQIHLRLTEEEYEELMRKKEFLGFKNYSSLIRMYIKHGACISVDFNAFYENATQIARVGNNINQIAKSVNETKDITPYQIQLLQKHMARLDKIFEDFTDEKVKLVKYISNEYSRGNNNGSNENN